MNNASMSETEVSRVSVIHHIGQYRDHFKIMGVEIGAIGVYGVEFHVVIVI